MTIRDVLIVGRMLQMLNELDPKLFYKGELVEDLIAFVDEHMVDSINGIDVRNDEPTGRKKRLKSSHSWDISFVSDTDLSDWLTSVLTSKSKDKEEGGSECDERR